MPVFISVPKPTNTKKYYVKIPPRDMVCTP